MTGGIQVVQSVSAERTRALAAEALLIPQNLLTTKGDVIAASGSSTPVRVGVGADGQVLTADSSQASGIKWAPAGGGLLAANNLSDVASVATSRGNLGIDGVTKPQNVGLIAWAFEPDITGSQTAAANGTLQVTRLYLDKAQTITSVVYIVGAAGSVLTSGQNFAALFQGTTLIGVTADQSTSWQSTGYKVMNLVGGPFNVTAGDIFVAYFSRGTTGPSMLRGINAGPQANLDLVAASSRFGTADTGLTTAMPSPMGTLVASTVPYWAGAK